MDVIAARVTALHGALGVSAPIGRTLRLEVAAGAGPAFAEGSTGSSLRADAIVRFLLDPDGVSRWGLYAGAGLSGRHEPAAGGRLLGAIVAGVEGRVRGAVVPFVEIGLGGGTRIGAGVRRAMRSRR